ncbi:MAG TPA: class I SAM-dependent methyltransferase [Pyrinomonadaceae bacterium]|nr:class I SAM-dependent methyltransferase [Pyrinomonadaceae bacterium]
MTRSLHPIDGRVNQIQYANVTVFDLSEAQLRRDREAAARFNVDIKTVQGEMQDLSHFDTAAFDIVYHGYSLGFVPNARMVFQQVARVLRPAGLYHFMCANPFFLGMREKDWNGEGYTIKHPYVSGAEIIYEDQEWFTTTASQEQRFRHRVSSATR